VKDFDSAENLGALSPAEVGEYLRQIKDYEGAAPFMPGGVQPQALSLLDRAYLHTGMIMGFIGPRQNGAKVSIAAINTVQGDARLIDKQVKIAMDKFYVHSYPGTGKHSILCEFAGKNQVAGETEELRYALRFEALDRSGASISGVPIFLGLTVGPNGIAFVGKTVNVRSETDDVILEAIDSPAFKNGLSLIAVAQPALKPLAGLASAAVKAVAKRSSNRQVHVFNLGLDFGGSATSARLQLGTYIVVQTNDTSWDWSRYYWESNSQNIKSRQDSQVPSVNYMAFSVTEYAPTT
jgi:hypothetical protein